MYVIQTTILDIRTHLCWAQVALLSVSDVHRIYVKHIVGTWREESVARLLIYAIQSIILDVYTHLRESSHAPPYSCLEKEPKLS